MILFVDDEPRFISSYVEYLRDIGNYEVDMIESVDTAIQRIENEMYNNKLQLVIMDIMMPPGESFKHLNTKKGLRTGTFLYQYIRRKYAKVPIIIFTNVSDPSVEEFFLKDSLCKFMRKEDYLLSDFLQEIETSVIQ